MINFCCSSIQIFIDIHNNRVNISFNENSQIFILEGHDLVCRPSTARNITGKWSIIRGYNFLDKNNNNYVYNGSSYHFPRIDIVIIFRIMQVYILLFQVFFISFSTRSI